VEIKSYIFYLTIRNSIVELTEPMKKNISLITQEGNYQLMKV